MKTTKERRAADVGSINLTNRDMHFSERMLDLDEEDSPLLTQRQLGVLEDRGFVVLPSDWQWTKAHEDEDFACTDWEYVDICPSGIIWRAGFGEFQIETINLLWEDIIKLVGSVEKMHAW